MQYLLYCVVCFRVRGIAKEVFMANVLNTTLLIVGFLCNGMPMMQELHQHDIRKLRGSHPPLVVIHIAHS
jgi:hypothetical protein